MSDFDFSKYKVLLCDTDPEVIDTSRTTYLDAGIGDYAATPSPKEALLHLPKMKPDLILISLKFPDTTGIEVIKQIRSMNDGEFYKTPILMLLDKVSQNLLREVCRVGIEGALRKPIRPEKILRFSRAVILKPRRFVCVRHYFGPERRMRADPHFDGDDRRNDFLDSELSTDEFTKNRPPSAGQSSLDSEPVLAGFASSSSGGDGGGTPDWRTSPTKPKEDGGVMDYSSEEFRSSKADGGVMDHSSEEFRSSSAKGGNADYDLSDTKRSSGADEYDFTSNDKSSAGNQDVDYGQSRDRKKAKDPVSDFTSKDKPNNAVKDLKAVKKAKSEPEEKFDIVATGPESDVFEEVIDLEECLNLHKTWVNSGGKNGQQARRPQSDFRGQDLEGADFTRAVLPQSNFEGVNCNSTVFRKADLSGSTFKGASLSSADMRVSRLSRADLRDARMDRVNFLGADLSGANLEGSSMRNVNLSGANLHRTNLRGVNLASARGLIPEQIKRAITDPSTRLPLDQRTTS